VGKSSTSRAGEPLRRHNSQEQRTVILYMPSRVTVKTTQYGLEFIDDSTLRESETTNHHGGE